jgi:hypothetical protein
MMRTCSHCQRPFTPQDLSKEESKGMEAERKALGLQGVLFRYYTCPACHYADIFLDVTRLKGETEDDYRRRRAELEATARNLHSERVEVVIDER